ncbi:MAG: protein kinase domain-containing protein, partial [Planctomycetota bacterium]
DPTPDPGASQDGIDFIPSKDSPARMPRQIGKFHIKKLIATGGMGAVYQGTQEQPRRNVAIKLMKSGVASKSALRRFEYESQLLARLKHPGIAEVYDAGTHEAHDGDVPYFVMEYIPGAKRITDYVREKKLSTRQRLELFIEVAQAVHHGHTKGVIHRDLKPDNILVDSHERVKVIDFGVARATDSDLAVTTLQTDIGQLIGTVQYMSPEQVEAEPDDLDTRSDVYSLGVVLYEMLCGRLPYDVSKLKIYDATRVVREAEAHKLSTIDTTLRGDVETIVAKALEKDRERRYQSAENLAADIRRYLNHEPINARPPSLTYQVRVYTRRHKALMTGVAAVFVALLLGVITSTVLWLDAAGARDFAEVKQGEAEAAQTLAESATELANARADTIQRNLYNAQMNMAAQSVDDTHGFNRIMELTDSWLPQPGAPDLRGWEWYLLRSQKSLALMTLEGHDDLVKSVDWSPDGRYIASGSDDATLRVWDASTGSLLHTLKGHEDNISEVAWSPGGDRLASGSSDRTVKIWNPKTWQPILNLVGHTGGVNSIAWSPDGSQLASAGLDSFIKVWDAVTGVQTGAFSWPDNSSTIWIQWSPDGKFLGGFGGQSRTLRIWDAQTLQEVDLPDLHDTSFHGRFAWSPDSKQLVVSPNDGSLRFYDTIPNRLTLTIEGGQSSGRNNVVIRWSPDGKRIAVGYRDKSLRVWDATSGRMLQDLRGHTEPVDSITWSPDGRLLASSNSSAIMVWDTLAPQYDGVITGHDDRVRNVAWSPDGTRLATASVGEPFQVWDAAIEQQIFTTDLNRGIYFEPEWSPDGAHIAVIHQAYSDGPNPDAADERTLRLLDPQTGQETAHWTAQHPGMSALAWSPDGSSLASGGTDKVVRLWDPRTGRVTGILNVHVASVRNIAWNHDGARLAITGSIRGFVDNNPANIEVWDPQTRQRVAVMERNHPVPWGLAWNHDSTLLASGDRGGVIRVWDPASGQI